MKPPHPAVRFNAKLHRPADAPTSAWTFLVLPSDASGKLPSRGMVSVSGTINGFPFRATLEPDGKKSHWLKVNRKMSDGARAAAGDTVAIELVPLAKEPEPRLPADLRKALTAAPEALAQWNRLTPVARRDWIQWLVSAKLPETRARRVRSSCSMLEAGKKRICCFDRSGFYSQALCAPAAAPD